MMGEAPPDDCPGYTACFETACGETFATCYGEGYEDGDFSGGACEPYLECVLECDCEQTCIAADCLSLFAEGACLTCSLEIATCAQECGDEAAACQE